MMRHGPFFSASRAEPIWMGDFRLGALGDVVSIEAATAAPRGALHFVLLRDVRGIPLVRARHPVMPNLAAVATLQRALQLDRWLWPTARLGHMADLAARLAAALNALWGAALLGARL
jgi:hypothetical protein